MYPATAAKSLQSCPTQCDPRDGSPPELPKPPPSRALCQAKRAPRAAFPSGSLAAQTKRWAEGIRVPGPLAGGGQF